MDIPQCPRCGATVVKIKDKDYYGCPNWLPHGAGCAGTIWYPGRKEDRYPEPWFTHKVESKSNPGHFHIVKIYESGDMDCPCVAGRMGKFDRHMKITVEDMEAVLKRIKKKYLEVYE